MITKHILIVMVWLLDGNIQTSTYEVKECPAQPVLEEYYNSLKDGDKIMEWSAWCTEVPWDPSLKIRATT